MYLNAVYKETDNSTINLLQSTIFILKMCKIDNKNTFGSSKIGILFMQILYILYKKISKRNKFFKIYIRFLNSIYLFSIILWQNK